MEKVLRSRKVMFWAYALLAFLLVYVGVRAYVVGTEYSDYKSEVGTSVAKVSSSSISLSDLRSYAEFVEALHGSDIRMEWNNPLHIWNSTDGCYYDFASEDECYRFALSILEDKADIVDSDLQGKRKYLNTTFGAVSSFRFADYQSKVSKGLIE